LRDLRPYQVATSTICICPARKTSFASAYSIRRSTSSFRTIHEEEKINEIAKTLGVDEQKVKDRIGQIQQANPMMGFRGVRLCVAYPEIYRMQATAIIQAAIKASKDLKHDVEPEIMIPLTGELKEFKYAKQIVVEAVEGEMKKEGKKLVYHVGTMIEVPRGALRAGDKRQGS
jgi:pyruvate,orthophosphate dikinase